MNTKIALIIGLFFCTPLFGQKNITVEKIWKEYQFMSSGGGNYKWQPDGTKYTRLIRTNEGQKIVEYDIKLNSSEGKELVNLSNVWVNGKNLVVDKYEFNSDQTMVILTTETESIYRHSYLTKHYILDLKTMEISPLDDQREKQTLPLLNPSRTKIAYISGRNLFVKDLTSKVITQITNDGSPNGIINGTTDWVYEEEFGITQAFDWSPDGMYIGYLKMDERDVKEFTMSYYGNLYPDLYTFKYPKAGEANSKVTAHIYNINKQSTVTIALDQYEYIPRINWSTTQNTLVLQTLNRHQNHLRYYKVEADKNGNWTANVFHEEQSTTYVDIDDNLSFFKDGKAILRTSDRDGYNHIYKVELNGKTTQLTKGNWDVINLYGLNKDNDALYFSAARAGAIHQGIYRLDMAKNKLKAISEEEHKNTANFTKDKSFFIKTSSTANIPNRVTLCDEQGKELQVLSTNDLLLKRIKEHQFATKRFTKIKLEGRELNAWMILPYDFDSTKQYPVYMNVYGGPGSNMVYDGWDNNIGFHQLLAQEGYIVLSVDPRGTQYNGSAFKKSTYLNLGKLETQDFIDVAKHIGNWSFVDKDRIGIQGWSYGGFMVANCMTKGDGIFKMGIAVAPVSHWKYYDNIYTERYMRTPDENPTGYDENSPISTAGQLKGKFLLIHGSADDNVHYQNALELVDALVKADKQFDLFIYPNKDHGITGGNTRKHLYEMMLNYVKDNL